MLFQIHGSTVALCRTEKLSRSSCIILFPQQRCRCFAALTELWRNTSHYSCMYANVQMYKWNQLSSFSSYSALQEVDHCHPNPGKLLKGDCLLPSAGVFQNTAGRSAEQSEGKLPRTNTSLCIEKWNLSCKILLKNPNSLIFIHVAVKPVWLNPNTYERSNQRQRYCCFLPFLALKEETDYSSPK